MVESIHKGLLPTSRITVLNNQYYFYVAQTLDEFNNKNCTQIKANVSQVLALENAEILQIFAHHGSF